MSRRNIAIMLGLGGVAIVVVLILAIGALSPTAALPLTDYQMIQKAETLPEVRAFINKYPNYSIAAADYTSRNADGYVEYRIGSWAAKDETRHGYMKFDNTIRLMVLFNRTSGEIVQTSLECDASTYTYEFGRAIAEVDPSKSFQYTSANKNILEFIEQGREEQCIK